MIEITKDDFKKFRQDSPKDFYKNTLRGTKANNKVLGEILFTMKGFGETAHRIPKRFHFIVFRLKELIETGNCDGKLDPLYKPRTDYITGFYSIYNQIKLAFIVLNIQILIAEDRDGNKYYLFKKISSNPNLGESKLSSRGGNEPINIIQENDENVNTLIYNDFKDLIVNEEILIGDCIKIQVQENNVSNKHEAVAELEKNLEKETLPELNDNFWRWFGDSVVKDDDGNPLICFHGSTLDIDEFDTEYSGNNTGNNEEKVFYFTTDRDTALSYSQEAVIRSKETAYYDKEEGTDYETWEEFEDYLRKEVCKTPHINPCFICMEKPYIYDANFRDFDPKLNYTLMSMIKGEIDTSHYLFDEELYYDIANEHEEYDEETDEYIQIKDFDYDGIIIKNVRDSISPLVDKYCDEYIVWSPTQIKSIYNKGNWSWNSRNVFETLNRELKRYL